MVSSGEIQENEIFPQEDTSHFKTKETSKKEVVACSGGNDTTKDNFTYFLSRKDKHQTGSSSFKDDDIVDDTDAKVNVKIPKRRAGSSFTDYKDEKRGKPSAQCNIFSSYSKCYKTRCMIDPCFLTN